LDAETAEDAYITIIHAYRNAEMIFTHRNAQQVARSSFQTKPLGDPIKLSLGVIEEVVRIIVHFSSSCHPSSSITAGILPTYSIQYLRLITYLLFDQQAGDDRFFMNPSLKSQTVLFASLADSVED
jgi:hypothetical protein